MGVEVVITPLEISRSSSDGVANNPQFSVEKF